MTTSKETTSTFEKLTRGIYEESQNGEAAFRSFADEAATTNRALVSAVNAATLDTLKTVTQIQNDAIASSVSAVEASQKVGNALTTIWIDMFRQGQQAATRLTEAGAKAVANSFEAQK